MLNRYHLTANKIEGLTSSHDYRNPTTVVENTVWGTGAARGSFANAIESSARASPSAAGPRARGESLPLPGALEDADGLTKIYLLHIGGQDAGWTCDGLHIELRGYGHGPDDLLDAGLITEDPKTKHRLVPAPPIARGDALGDGVTTGGLADTLHQLLATAALGDDVEALVRKKRSWSLVLEGLR